MLAEGARLRHRPSETPRGREADARLGAHPRTPSAPPGVRGARAARHGIGRARNMDRRIRARAHHDGDPRGALQRGGTRYRSAGGPRARQAEATDPTGPWVEAAARPGFRVDPRGLPESPRAAEERADLPERAEGRREPRRSRESTVPARRSSARGAAVAIEARATSPAKTSARASACPGDRACPCHRACPGDRACPAGAHRSPAADTAA